MTDSGKSIKSKTEHPTAKPLEPVFPLAVAQIATQSKVKESRKRGYFSKIKNWINLGTLLFVAAYTVASFQQKNASISQVIETQLLVDLTKLQIRPTMRIELAVDTTVEGDKITKWSFTPRWTNSGQTDAIDWIGADNLAFVQRGISPRSLMDSPKEGFGENKNTIAPGELIQQTTQYVTIQEAEQALSGAKAIFIFGYIEWRDRIPGTPTHYRRWSYFLHPIRTDKGTAFEAPRSYPDYTESGDKPQ